MIKECIKCRSFRAIEDFPKRSNGNRRGECKKCTAKIAREYRRDNKEKLRTQSAMNLYNLTEKQVNKLYSNTKCGICNEFIDNQKGKHIDHCHDTGNVRGILCSRCNVGLGMFRDNKEFLKKAIKWIK